MKTLEVREARYSPKVRQLGWKPNCPTHSKWSLTLLHPQTSPEQEDSPPLCSAFSLPLVLHHPGSSTPDHLHSLTMWPLDLTHPSRKGLGTSLLPGGSQGQALQLSPSNTSESTTAEASAPIWKTEQQLVTSYLRKNSLGNTSND